MRALDELPLPAWDLVDVERYRAIWRQRHGYYAMNLATTRGCPFHCNWCAKPIYGQRYAVRSPENVVEEIAWLKQRYAPDQLAVVDDVFGLQPGWVEHFAELVERRDVRVPFRCLMRADQVNARRGPGAGRALAVAWCGWAPSQDRSAFSTRWRKALRVEQIRHAADELQRNGIDVGLFLQFGYPGEKWDDVEATLRLVRDIVPADIGVSVSYPLAGHQVLRARSRPAWREAELVRLRRSRNDVSRDLRAGVLSHAASRRAS